MTDALQSRQGANPALTAQHLENRPKETFLPVMVAIGVILILGGLFLTLAATQILPKGANAISAIGTGGFGGRLIGTGMLAIGFVIAVIGAFFLIGRNIVLS